MPLRASLWSGALRRRSWAVAVLVCGLLGLGAAQATAAGDVVTSFALTPASTQAGGNPDVTVDLGFAYAIRDDSVETVTIALAPGLLASIANVPATCTDGQLRANACPVDSRIGTGSVTLVDVARARDVTLHLMPPPSPEHGAGFGAVLVEGGDVYAGIGTLDIVSGAGGQPVGEVKLSVPVVGGQQVDQLVATMHATTTDGKAFTRLPTSCSTATSSVSAETVEGDTGSGSNSFTPSGCEALGYAPALSVVEAIKDPGDDGVELIATLSQPSAATESATEALVLQWPPSLSPYAALAATCLTGTPCTIGTATATSPLAPASYLSSGTVTLGGSALAPTLTVAFPAPVPLSLTGAIDIVERTISFANLPDLPLSALTVDITGPNGGKLLGTTCAAGDVVASFTPQSGGATVVSATPIAYEGCPAPKLKPKPKPPPKPPPHAERLRVSIHSRRALVLHRRARVRLSCRGPEGDACRGRLSLTARKRIVRRVAGQRRVIRRKVVVARVRYAVASGRTKTVALPLTTAGLRLLERSRHRRLRVRATATVRGGTGARRAIVVRLRRPRRSP